MIVVPIPAGPLATVCYLACDREGGEAVAIDAPPEGARLLLAAAARLSLAIRSVIVTHGHFDHLVDAAALREATGARVCIHEADADGLRRPSTLGFPLPLTLRPAEPDLLLRDGDAVACGPLSFAVLHTPGHTRGGICLHEARERALFSGDTLLRRGVGRSDLPGGSWDELLRGVTGRLLALPDDTVVYPGHGAPTTIGEERRENLFIQDYLDHFDA